MAFHCHDYEGRSCTKCSTRRFVMTFCSFRNCKPILKVETLFSVFDSSNCQLENFDASLTTSVRLKFVCRFAVSFPCGVSSFGDWPRAELHYELLLI